MGSQTEFSGRRAIFVVGMHRSGTSALTKLLALRGIALPARLIGATSDNEKGFWEPSAIVDIHDELLKTAGSSWDDLAAFPDSWFLSDVVRQFRHRLTAALERDFGDAAIFAMKDPRLCRLLPLWLSILEERRIAPLFVIPVRNPLEVAASLKKRDAFSTDRSLLLWLQHFLAAERHTRGYPRSFIAYHRLLNDWRGVLNTIGRDIGVSWPDQSYTSDAGIEEFLSADLRHHSMETGELYARGNVAEWVKTAFSWAMRAAEGLPAEPDDLDKVRGELTVAERVFMPLIIEYQNKNTADVNTIEILRQEINVGHEILSESKIHAENLERQVQTHKSQLTYARDRNNYLVTRLDTIENSTWWTIGEPLRTMGKRFPHASRLARLAARAAYWTLSGQLLTRLRQRRARVSGSGAKQDARPPSDDRPALLSQIQASTTKSVYYKPDPAGTIAPANPSIRLIAFYLPQFHAIPENDLWWGRGFTEWTNVTRALPRFVGHIQPHLPADLGFYDLSNPETLKKQIILARRYGIGGFCFHYYWFNGRRLLEKPLDMLLGDPGIDMPFCINWANENWTRRWDGLDDDILLAQEYSPEDDIAFARGLIPIVTDPRYIRVDGRPLVMIYRPALLPDPAASVRRWREEFVRAGLEDPYVVMAQGFGDLDPRPHGIDAAVEFPPHKIAKTPPINNKLELLDPQFRGHVVDYEAIADYALSLPTAPYKLFRGVIPSWDNEARKPGMGFTIANSTPSKYGAWLAAACRLAVAEARHPDERIVFVNAWNEWAEGAYLEPDRHFGHAYLIETARVLAGSGKQDGGYPGTDRRVKIAIVSHDAHFHGAQLVSLALVRTLVTDHNIDLTVLLGGPGELTDTFRALAPTEVIPGDFADLAPWRNAARLLVANGVTAVLSNSLVSARALSAFRLAGLRVVQLVHELPTLIRNYGLEQTARDVATDAEVVVFSSSYAKERFEELAGTIRGQAVLRHQGLYMPPLSSEERSQKRKAIRQRLGIGDDRRLVLGVGFGDMRKGLDLWPNMARAVLAKCPEAAFLWVGTVEPSVAKLLADDMQAADLKDRFFLHGNVLLSELAGMYAAADVFALTSREDPFPSVVIEAMASGLPTVVFEGSGGIVELVRDAGGVCVPYLDVGAMARELSYLLRDVPAANEMGAKVADHIAQGFDFGDYAADMLALAIPSLSSISVVVPNYNYARHLRQRIESIWAQTVRVREIILLDDASTDDSEAVIASLAVKSPVPFRVVRNSTNSGSVARQWAKGIALAKGNFVWIAEADDFADPTFLAVALRAFKDPAIVMSYTESRMAGDDGEITGPDYRAYVADVDPVRWTADFRSAGTSEVARALAIKNTVPNVSAAVFRRGPLAEVVEEQLDGMVSYRNAADWFCYMHLLAHKGDIAFSAEILNTHRRHSGSITAHSDKGHLAEIVAMQDLAMTLVPVPPEIRASALRYRREVADKFRISLEDIA